VDEIALAPALAELLATESVTDVLLNGCGETWVDSAPGLSRLETNPFASELELQESAIDLVASAGRHLDAAHPFADVALPGGLRLHAVLASACSERTLVSIRKHRAQSLSLDDLRESEMVSGPQASLLERIVANRESFLIAGATGVGKTTLLRAMMGLCSGERILVLEDVSELAVGNPEFISLQTRQANVEGRGEVGLERLVRESLRMRPDRLVVGEVRGAELLVMLQALNTGHSGAGATIHANSLDGVAKRLTAIGQAAGLSAEALAAQAASALSWVIQLDAVRVEGRRQRRLSAIGRCGLDDRGGLEIKEVSLQHPSFRVVRQVA